MTYAEQLQKDLDLPEVQAFFNTKWEHTAENFELWLKIMERLSRGNK
jgi:hypothetical protein